MAESNGRCSPHLNSVNRINDHRSDKRVYRPSISLSIYYEEVARPGTGRRQHQSEPEVTYFLRTSFLALAGFSAAGALAAFLATFLVPFAGSAFFGFEGLSACL